MAAARSLNAAFHAGWAAAADLDRPDEGEAELAELAFDAWWTAELAEAGPVRSAELELEAAGYSGPVSAGDVLARLLADELSDASYAGGHGPVDAEALAAELVDRLAEAGFELSQVTAYRVPPAPTDGPRPGVIGVCMGTPGDD